MQLPSWELGQGLKYSLKSPTSISFDNGRGKFGFNPESILSSSYVFSIKWKF
jgi:hypothetical protein